MEAFKVKISVLRCCPRKMNGGHSFYLSSRPLEQVTGERNVLNLDPNKTQMGLDSSQSRSELQLDGKSSDIPSGLH